MAVEEIFTKLLSHMAKGLVIHDQLSTAYGFLSLQGYQKCQEYHYYSETNTYQSLKKYFLDYYGKMILEDKVQDVNIIPQPWYKYARKDVDSNIKRQSIRELIKKWIDWEMETKDLLKLSYKELNDDNEFCSAKKILELLEDVVEEIKTASNKLIELESINYDMTYILEEQEYLYNKYKEKIEKVFKGGDEQ